jgi:ubiquinol-cytochrome c reductase cytochrome c1 subunit
MRPVRLAAIGALLALAGAPAMAQETSPLPKQNWSFAGPFGTFDRAAAQRGFQVYKEVCSNCHSLKQGHYRNLSGIGLTPEQISAIASSVTVPTIGDDQFRSPFPNENAARAANNGALPPDLSVITKAREGGADYVDGILTGYSDPPANMKMADGMNYNKFFPGNQIAMPQPLHDGQVTYADGSPNSVADEAHDVVTFLAYMAEPETEQRKRIGVRMVLFLIVLTGLVYAVKRRVWANVEH